MRELITILEDENKNFYENTYFLMYNLTSHSSRMEFIKIIT